jgi:hypothetical protein
MFSEWSPSCPARTDVRGGVGTIFFACATGGERMRASAFPFYIGIRLTKREKQLLDEMAAKENTTTSGMVRELIVRESVRPLLEAHESQDVA